jgi:guanine deaminase
MTINGFERTIYCGAFVHCASPDKLDICNSAAIGVDEAGKIVFIERDIKDFASYRPKQGWDDAKFVHLEHNGFFFPGFIGMAPFQ